MSPSEKWQNFLDEFENAQRDFKAKYGIDLVTWHDPDGVETYDESGSRLREYNTKNLRLLVSEVQRIAEGYQLLGMSENDAMLKAATLVLEKAKLDQKDYIDELEKKHRLENN